MSLDILSEMVITKVYSACTLYTPQGAKAKKTSRERWSVILKYEGKTVYTMGDDKRQISSDRNHLILLPKSASYEWECTETGHFSLIDFECELTHPIPISIPIKHYEKLVSIFKELEYKRNLRTPFFETESIRDAYSVMLGAAAQSAEKYVPSSKQQKLGAAIEYISHSFNTPITNEQLAALSGMSTVYFRKLFREIMGTSPIAYARKIRIEKAKEMLRSDYGTLGDLAISLGYSSLYDFSRDFKKHVGIAPSKY